MKGFLQALQFLTVISIRAKSAIDKTNLSRSTLYFPLVGLVIGLILVGINGFLLFIPLEQGLISVILVTVLIILTGGLHLDGLADTFDAFSGGRDREEILRIMRDSHIGVMGVLSLIMVILLKISFLSSISMTTKTASLLLMCLLSRWSLVLAIFLFPYARREGTAKIFMQGISYKALILASGFTLVSATAIWRIKGLFVFIIIVICTYIIGKTINNKIGGITGDTLGAINELTEVIVLFCITILERVNLWII